MGSTRAARRAGINTANSVMAERKCSAAAPKPATRHASTASRPAYSVRARRRTSVKRLARDEVHWRLAILRPRVGVLQHVERVLDPVHGELIPVLVGGGKQALPDGIRLQLEHEDQQSFSGGFVYLRYRSRATGSA